MNHSTPRATILTLLLVMMVLAAIPINSAYGINRQGRLGVGMTQQLVNNLPAISLKLQKSNTMAFSALVALDSDDTTGGFGAGLKGYRIIFEEPQLNFYISALGALISQTTAGTKTSGFQVDLTMGSEFHFTGLNSLGFSFEVGGSMNKLDSLVIQTVGYHFITASIHFYL
jgi:hypothetical protein